ncbi:hypothetical protein Mkiyose1088_40970 [Mycobacterium kiyosense]|nr:hypothetical protein SRL2020130_01920 [Mycobacterium kiyosense]GLC06494.1 hypothetical protein SRL2020411_11400 [Mycobacterium kiyosense]GLC11589.1 hypothetical protein SRL2020448_01920 [Mycobacterium kiyosense]GLD02231.1 hypothetical protein Mkiyose1088_40970 [Mycobacterium kiyosense]GLD04185.1 hypothetical protein Mkiyose1383_05110 [Mycobacterium kiyosense]
MGAEVILDRLGAEQVTAFDVDESMVELARRRLHGRHVPDWQRGDRDRPGAASGRAALFEEVPRHILDSWVLRTFIVHLRENRFEAGEFATELARHGLHGRSGIEARYGGLLFVGAARKL